MRLFADGILVEMSKSDLQKKYSKYLAKGEEVVSAFGIGDRYFWTNALVFFPMSFLLIGLPFLLKIIHLRHSKTYIFTNRRIIVKDGVFSIKVTSAPYDKITHLEVKEDFFTRISYGVGDITVHTAGRSPIEINLVKIQNPLAVKNLLEELIISERSLLGVIHEDPLVKPVSFD